MSEMMTATVSIEGTRIMLWNAFNPSVIPPKKREAKGGAAGNDPDEWKRSVLVTDQGQLYVTTLYVFGCLRDGARYTKTGRYSLQPRVVATLQVLDECILTNRFLPQGLTNLTTDPEELVHLDIRGVKNPSTRGRNVRYRVATLAGWQMTFHLLWNVTIVSREQMEAVIIDAGNFCGLGDGRALGFGRFRLTHFEVGNWPPA